MLHEKCRLVGSSIELSDAEKERYLNEVFERKFNSIPKEAQSKYIRVLIASIECKATFEKSAANRASEQSRKPDAKTELQSLSDDLNVSSTDEEKYGMLLRTEIMDNIRNIPLGKLSQLAENTRGLREIYSNPKGSVV